MINTRLIYASIIISSISLILLILFPDLDIKFSQLFYDTQHGFIYRNNFIVVFLFLIIPIITKILFTVVLMNLFYQLIKAFCIKKFGSDVVVLKSCKSLRNLIMKIALSSSFYFILTVGLGSGLTVNYVFKENFGRARPMTTKDFGGTKNFSGPLAISNQCQHNCSFSSGHAAMGYSLTSLAYIFCHIYFTRIYSIALIFGSLVGFSRILMGAHFLSDVITSCLVVLVINHLIYLWQKKLRAL